MEVEAREDVREARKSKGGDLTSGRHQQRGAKSNRARLDYCVKRATKNKRDDLLAGGGRGENHKSGRQGEKTWRGLALVDVPLEEEPVPGRSLRRSCLKSAACWTTGSAENMKQHQFIYLFIYLFLA